MTDQVPNFTLPSQEAALNPVSTNPLLIRTIGLAKRVLPVLGVLVVAVWGLTKLVKRAQEKQLRDFQTQLQSFSSMLDLDTDDQQLVDSANMAKQILDPGRKYKFRSDESAEDDISSKVRLDLFRAGATNAPAKKETLPGIEVEQVVPSSQFETCIADSLTKIEGADQPAKTAAAQQLKEAREGAGLSQAEANAVFSAYVSKVVSMQIDRAAVNIDSDDNELLKNLHQLALTMASASILGPEALLKYVGAHAGQEATRETLYRRYAVFCLSSEERVRDDLQSLDDMQRLLSINDARAETINTDIAKGMFQVAVSAAMADGSMKESDREALSKIKDSFGEFLEDDAADNITSEVAVMRAMYALQQMLQEQGVTADDVKELRKMCKDLGVDIEDMLQNADELGDALGAEAKLFVDNLRKLLTDIPDVDSNMATLGTASDAVQENGGPDAS